MNFSKWQGLGNDFVFLEDSAFPSAKLPELAKQLCDRHFGIGADGLVLVLPAEEADVEMRIFNADGSEAEMCGNALRCIAKYAAAKGFSHGKTLRIKTKAGIKEAGIISEENGQELVQVDMGEPILEREKIPVLGPKGSRMVAEEIEVAGEIFVATAVSMGNPHCLLFIPQVETAPVREIGPLLEKHALFPQWTNVEFIEVKSPEEISLRVWERGVGETLACGTGACASVVGAVLCGKTKSSVRVNLPGGRLVVSWLPDNHVRMTGPAEEVFRGKLLKKLDI